MLHEEDGARFVAAIHPIAGGFRASYTLAAEAGPRFEETLPVYHVEPTEAQARTWLHNEAARLGYMMISWADDD